MVGAIAREPNLTADGKTLFDVPYYSSADLKHLIEADIYLPYTPETASVLKTEAV